jgi:uncharacterized protein YecE (DUF72 family)
LAPAAGARGIRVGTSGWIYRDWRGDFYPEGLAQTKWLGHYASTFTTSEINATFYRLPTQATVARWREATPPDFEFAWKASRFITHMKRLKDAEPSIARVYAPMLALGAKLGPALFQVPPQMACDLPRLRDFLSLLPPGRRHAIEFRHPSWYADAVLHALTDHDIALCVSDHHHAPAPWIATASFAYVRGHGPAGSMGRAPPGLAGRGTLGVCVLRQRHRLRRTRGRLAADPPVGEQKGRRPLKLGQEGLASASTYANDPA